MKFLMKVASLSIQLKLRWFHLINVVLQIYTRDRNSIKCKHITLDVELDQISTSEEIVLKVKIVPNKLLWVGEIDDPRDENSYWLRDAYEYIAKNLVTDYFSIMREFYWGDGELIIHVATYIAQYVYDTAAEISKVIDYSLNYNIHGK